MVHWPQDAHGDGGGPVDEGLAGAYRDYLACLDARAWSDLGRHVAEGVVHDDRPLGLAGYRRMLEDDVAAIPDLRFVAQLVVVDPPHVASRLWFDCHPRGTFLGLPVDGRRVAFAEHATYRFDDARRVQRVWSVVDRAAIAAQLPG